MKIFSFDCPDEEMERIPRGILLSTDGLLSTHLPIRSIPKMAGLTLRPLWCSVAGQLLMEIKLIKNPSEALLRAADDFCNQVKVIWCSEPKGLEYSAEISIVSSNTWMQILWYVRFRNGDKELIAFLEDRILGRNSES